MCLPPKRMKQTKKQIYHKKARTPVGKSLVIYLYQLLINA